MNSKAKDIQNISVGNMCKHIAPKINITSLLNPLKHLLTMPIIIAEKKVAYKYQSVLT